MEVEPRRPSWRLWLAAGLGALALHAACAVAAIASLRSDEADDDLGAPAIEIGLEPASQRGEQTDLPPGPESDASAATPAMQEQKVATEQAELPKERPVESETADRAVTVKDPIKPKEEEPTVKKERAEASEESTAAEATAAPKIAALPEAPRTVAPAQGIGESARRARLTWQKELVAHFDRHKRYPAGHPARATEIVMSFELDRTGHVLSSRVVRSSGDPLFDDAALAMLKRSDPVPAPPPLVADEGLTFTLPVIFRVKGKG